MKLRAVLSQTHLQDMSQLSEEAESLSSLLLPARLTDRLEGCNHVRRKAGKEMPTSGLRGNQAKEDPPITAAAISIPTVSIAATVLCEISTSVLGRGDCSPIHA